MTILQGEDSMIKIPISSDKITSMRFNKSGCNPVAFPVDISLCNCVTFVEFNTPCLDKGRWIFELLDNNQSVVYTDSIDIK